MTSVWRLTEAEEYHLLFTHDQDAFRQPIPLFKMSLKSRAPADMAAHCLSLSIARSCSQDAVPESGGSSHSRLPMLCSTTIAPYEPRPSREA